MDTPLIASPSAARIFCLTSKGIVLYFVTRFVWSKLFIEILYGVPIIERNMMEINEVKNRLADEGYCIFENLISPEEAERLDSLARPMMDPMGNDYISLEGALNHFPELAQLCIHPLILDVAESVLGEGFIIANNVAMKWCKPGTPQHGLHADWPTSGALRAGPGSPIPPWNGLQVFWLLTDGTPENGATRIVPFSHHTQRAPQPRELSAGNPSNRQKGFSICLPQRTLASNRRKHNDRPASHVCEYILYAQVGIPPAFNLASSQAENI